jgi:hypothetical protein
MFMMMINEYFSLNFLCLNLDIVIELFDKITKLINV